MTFARPLALGVRFLLISLLAVALPLAAAGLWLVRDSARAGEALLRGRMDGTLEELARETGSRWISVRSRILDLAEDPMLQTALAGSGATGFASPESHPGEGGAPGPGVGVAEMPHLASAHWGLADILQEAVVTDPMGREVTRLDWSPGRERSPRPWAGLPATVEIRDGYAGTLLGHLELRLAPEALLAGWSEWAARTGGVLGALDARTGLPLVGGPFDPNLLTEERFLLGGEEWITARRDLSVLPVVLVLASPLEPFALPFRAAARRGLLLILAVGASGIALASFLTVRTTRPVVELATAAEAVARGKLETRVTPEGPEEVARAGRAFNSMAGSLERTLDTLAKREALAAVGEFASALAHELRNPLTAIRLDLQRIDEVSGDEEKRAVLTDRMLAAARQLDRTVEGVLRIAGSGGVRLEPVSLGQTLQRAARTAHPTFEARGAELELPSDEGLPLVEGDAAALEEVFLNLLLNAAEAMEEGGRAMVKVEENGEAVSVVVSDTGPGIPQELRERVLEPLFTTKPRGTGLGLAIAHRIVRAHGGELCLGDAPGGGARVEVRLPAPG